LAASRNLEPYPFTEQEADFLFGYPFPGVNLKQEILEGEASIIIGGPLKLDGQQDIKVKVPFIKVSRPNSSVLMVYSTLLSYTRGELFPRES
jgi:hypothetical protein